MKKIFTYLFLTAVLLLSGCQRTPSAPSPAPASEIGKDGQADQVSICLSLCEYRIQNLCRDAIEEYQAAGASLEETIMDEASCQLMCEAEWTEDTIACVTDADDCAQLSDSEPYCTELNENEEKSVPDAGCSAACRKYGDCVRYGDDISETDVQDAYATCMEVCASAPSKVVGCINSHPISKPSDCMLQSACVLPALDEIINR
jgi:hypothetical protein